MLPPDQLTDQLRVEPTEEILAELRTLIYDLGKDGGIISPSVYDTAQVLRFHPPKEGVEPALAWLLSQQQSDGGWGDPIAPLARDIPTLAAILAIHQYGTSVPASQAVDNGLAFVLGRRDTWGSVAEEIPVAAELIIPALTREIQESGLGDVSGVYRSLLTLSQRRLKALAKRGYGRQSSAVFSWEAWGRHPSPHLLDASGSVGSSPAATAAWLQRTSSSTVSSAQLNLAAENYLQRAAAATKTGIPGVYPTVWPINRFEQAFSLYAMLATGAVWHPAVQKQVRAQILDLHQAVTADGIGFSDNFLPDGDDTAAAIAVLAEFGMPIEGQPLEKFMEIDHFVAYPGEIQSSPSLAARAIHAMRILGHDVAAYQRYLCARQQSDGRWPGDKWNVSWLYTTSHVLLALSSTTQVEAVRAGIGALLKAQNDDGAWGSRTRSCPNETAYALMALDAYRNLGSEGIAASISAGRRWLIDFFVAHRGQSTDFLSTNLWQNKELYSPYRIDRTYFLAAMLGRGDLNHTAQESSYEFG